MFSSFFCCVFFFGCSVLLSRSLSLPQSILSLHYDYLARTPSAPCARPVCFMLSTRILILLFSQTAHRQRSRKRSQWNTMFLIYLTQAQEFLTDRSAMRGRQKKNSKQFVLTHVDRNDSFELHFRATMDNFHESIIFDFIPFDFFSHITQYPLPW